MRNQDNNLQITNLNETSRLTKTSIYRQTVRLRPKYICLQVSIRPKGPLRHGDPQPLDRSQSPRTSRRASGTPREQKSMIKPCLRNETFRAMNRTRCKLRPPSVNCDKLGVSRALRTITLQNMVIQDESQSPFDLRSLSNRYKNIYYLICYLLLL